MSTSGTGALRLLPKKSDAFLAHSIATPEDEERRREDARILLVKFLVRRILAQAEVIEFSGKAA